MPNRLSWIFGLVSVAVVPLALTACGSSSGGSTTPTSSVTAPDAKSALGTSAEKFAQVSSYQLKFDGASASQVDGFRGIAAYRNGKAVFAQTDLTGSSTANADFVHYLFLPPDLYFQRRDGEWFVQSPWNQGYRPGQLPSLGIEAPIVDYAQLARAIKEIQRKNDETIGSKRAVRYGGRVAAGDLPLLAESDGPNATVDIWLDEETGLPRRTELAIDDATRFQLTIDFDKYDAEVVAPAAPASAGPLRDVNFPDAACIGDALAGCLKAQSDLAGADSCAGSGRRVCLVPLGNISGVASAVGSRGAPR